MGWISASVVVALVCGFVTGVDFNCAQSNTWPAVEKVGGGKSDYAFVMSILSTTRLVATPTLGFLSERIPVKFVIFICMLGFSLGGVLITFAASTTELFVARALAGIGMAGISVELAVISKATSEADRTGAITTYFIAQGVGSMSGPLIAAKAGSLGLNFNGIDLTPISVFGLMVAFAGGITAILSLLFIASSSPKATDTGAAKKSTTPETTGYWGPIIMLLVAWFIHVEAVASIQALVAPLTSQELKWDPSETAYLISFEGAVQLAVYLGVKVLSSYFSDLSLMRVGLLLHLGSQAGLLRVFGPFTSTQFLVSYVLYTVANPLVGAVGNAAFSKLVKGEGAMMSVLTSTTAAARIVTPPIALYLMSSNANFLPGMMLVELLAALGIAQYLHGLISSKVKTA